VIASPRYEFPRLVTSGGSVTGSGNLSFRSEGPSTQLKVASEEVFGVFSGDVDIGRLVGRLSKPWPGKAGGSPRLGGK